MYMDDVSAIHFALQRLSPVWWRAEKPIFAITAKNTDSVFSAETSQVRPYKRLFSDETFQFIIFSDHLRRIKNPAADYMSQLDIAAADRVHLSLKDSTPKHKTFITPKRDEDGEDFSPDKVTAPNNVMPKSLPEG